MSDICRCDRCEGVPPEDSDLSWINRVNEKCVECGFELPDNDTAAVCPDCDEDDRKLDAL